MNNNLKGYFVKLNGVDYTNVVIHNEKNVHGSLTKSFIHKLENKNGNLGKHWVFLIEEFENGYLGYAVLSFGLDRLISNLTIPHNEWLEIWNDKVVKSRKYKSFISFTDLFKNYPKELGYYSFINRPILYIPKKINFLKISQNKIDEKNLFDLIHNKMSVQTRKQDYLFLENIEHELGKMIK